MYIEVSRYVALYYTDGDQCELTETPRTVEVKLRYEKTNLNLFFPQVFV